MPTAPRFTAAELPRYMAVHPMFQGLSEADLGSIADQGSSFLRLPRGHVLFSSGETYDQLTIIITGQVKVFALSTHGGEKVLDLIGPGQTVGESSVFGDQPQAFNAQTLTEALLLRIPKGAITAQIRRDPGFALRLLAAAGQRIRGLQHDVESYCLRSGLQRVVGFLLEGQRHSPERRAPHTVSLPVSKATIASRLSLTPEYFSRVLRELEDEGLIQISRRDIHILQPEELASYTLQ